MRWGLAALFLTTVCALPAFAVDRISYAAGAATCGGYPRAPIAMAKGFCAGIVVAPPADFTQRTLHFPRLLLKHGADWLLTDMDGWGSRNGRVFRVHAAAPGQVTLTPLLTGLRVPHGLAQGPDGKIYVGESVRVFRFDPDAADPQATVETVIPDLPQSLLKFDLHPLTAILFDANNDMLVSVGAPSDRCALTGTADKPDGTTVCVQSEGDVKAAGVRRYKYLGGGKWSPGFTMLARGLRNSLALVRHSSGTLLGGDNGIDLPGADEPDEELNVLRDGAHYGWPYCFEVDRTGPAWVGAGAMDCKSPAHTPPARLLPPHGAPLSMLYYQGAMFPQLRGKLLIALHGYRPAGARIAAFTVDAKGVPLLTPHATYASFNGDEGDAVTEKPYPGPASQPLLLTPGWNKITGTRPMGSPLGLAVADDGAIWVTEDKNATILRIVRDGP